MKKLVIAAVLFCTIKAADAQQFVAKNGKVHFFSKSPLEDIEATSSNTVCALNTSTQKVYAKIPVKSFKFTDKLMEEHFNENYLETEIFPNSVLDAVIVEKIDFTKDGVYDVTLKGTLDMHGVKKDREIKGKLTVQNGVPVSATADFIVKLADHKIKIPKAVVANLAEEIKVDINFAFEKYEKK